MTYDDKYWWFCETWEDNYEKWHQWAVDAWPDATYSHHKDYDHGRYILPAAALLCESITSEDIAYQAGSLIDAALASARENPRTGYYHWQWFNNTSGDPAKGSNTLSELQWACGVAMYLERVADGRIRPIEEYTPEWAIATARWIDKNLIENHYERYQRVLIDKKIRGADKAVPTGCLIDKPAIYSQVGYHLDRILQIDGDRSIAWTGPKAEQWGTPETWMTQICQSAHIFQWRGDAMLWDVDNPHLPDFSDPNSDEEAYYYPDTGHANRWPRAFLEIGAEVIDPWLLQGMVKTAERLISYIDGYPSCANYITGQIGHSFLGNIHPRSGIEGFGSPYDGFNALAKYSAKIKDDMDAIMEMVRAGEHVHYSLNATYQRCHIPYGVIGLTATSLWTHLT